MSTPAPGPCRPVSCVADRVAILSLNRAEILIAYLAIIEAGFVAGRPNIKFFARDHRVHPLIRPAGGGWRLSTPRAVPCCPKGLPVVDFECRRSRRLHRRPEPRSFRDRAPASWRDRPWFSTPRADRPPRACPLSHDGHLWAGAIPEIGCRPAVHGRQPALLVAAPLFHMNALGPAKFAIAAGASTSCFRSSTRAIRGSIGLFQVTLPDVGAHHDVARHARARPWRVPTCRPGRDVRSGSAPDNASRSSTT